MATKKEQKSRYDFTGLDKVYVVYRQGKYTPPYCGTTAVQRLTRDWVYIDVLPQDTYHYSEFRFSTKDLHGERMVSGEKKFNPSWQYKVFLTFCDACKFMERLRFIEDIKAAAWSINDDTSDEVVYSIHDAMKEHSLII